MKLLKRLLIYARPYHHFLPEYLIYTFFGIVFGLLNFTMLIPLLNLLFGNGEQTTVIPAEPSFSVSISYLIDLFNYHFLSIAILKGKMAAMAFVCVIIGAGTVLSNFFRYMSMRVLVRLKLKMLEKLRVSLYDKLLDQSQRFFHSRKKGDILSTLTNDVQEIEYSVISSFQTLLRDPFVIIAYFIALFYLSPSLTLFTLFFFPVSGILISQISKRLKKKGYFNQEMLGKILHTSDESITGIRIIQAFRAGDRFKKNFRDLNGQFTRSSKALFNQREIASPLSELLGVIVIIVVVMYGGNLVLQGSLSGSMFITYLALYSQILQPAKNLGTAITNMQRGLVATERVFNIIDEPVSIMEKTNAIQAGDFSNEIRFENVVFAYDESSVLNNISFTIPRGKMIALVGKSGSGKSTLADLLLRFQDVNEGKVLIDGIDIRDITLESLRGQIGLVNQEPILFNDSILNNITMGAEADMEKVKSAARMANASEFIEQLEEGFETKVGDRGSRLSGGQKQRIAIARALYKNPPILILDEATSALDTESERLVQDALHHLMENRTTLVIAHRLSTIQHSDEIIVLDAGRIAERGTHAELSAKNGLYRKLCDLQSFE
ncbi:MAG TPA: ABC transporter ATP-binding protein [Flavobacteriales bacterium]|nr:ABC transporter ATP-binding protein [Flavobacteriales bacterium]HRE95466.1 ABC transporter ATP-binding protein [Flavobacteriales bacterium]HRJ34619.1 ABC transporter ATP-binding protein [Flavobacteriales bacterium]HRJ37353.1 ABC transporter ATP-binding protein [Flavobacteriales bacterium]